MLEGSEKQAQDAGKNANRLQTLQLLPFQGDAERRRPRNGKTAAHQSRQLHQSSIRGPPARLLPSATAHREHAGVVARAARWSDARRGQGGAEADRTLMLVARGVGVGTGGVGAGDTAASGGGTAVAGGGRGVAAPLPRRVGETTAGPPETTPLPPDSQRIPPEVAGTRGPAQLAAVLFFGRSLTLHARRVPIAPWREVTQQRPPESEVSREGVRRLRCATAPHTSNP
jgi:hypothetical protein